MSLQGDIGDQAATIQFRDNAIALSFYRKPEGPAETGHCLHCGETLTGKRWCNADCRDAWELTRKHA